MTPSERAAFAAELATLSGDALQTLLSQTDPFDDTERFFMIEDEANQVWAAYQAESEAREKATTHGCAACGAKDVPYVLTQHACPTCEAIHVDMCCASCAAEME